MEKAGAKKRNASIIAMVAVVLLSFSNLLVFSDRISSKPTEAGFWMILLFGFCLGAAFVNILKMIKKQKP